ncbi:CheB methylesterase [Deinococcus phoenicis]|uniref:protein-glutamate methylesterase n=1 Tax=Deinococcus phoenicis TaxID=1476583 RepID=A0A016QTY5_9DEIO|nr:chemotaxis protein CheB [Deinococcus phoenicis]EYB69456.1 CheB methylesterase [Deinococcus phoenicis]
MAAQHIVVIGASAGGVESLLTLAASLPADFPAPILVVLHVAAGGPSLLPQLLRGRGPLPAAHAQDQEPLMPGHIYVAPPDHHLLVEPGRVAVTRGPKENRFRPSVDALFRSAAYVYGPAVIGAVLSGTLDDGTSGLWTVKRRGGVAVVQAPDDALFPEMPLNALQQVDVDHVVPVAGLGALLTRLVSRPDQGEDRMNEEERQRLEAEVRIAAEHNALQSGIMGMGDLSPLTCPECHGTLVRLTEGRNVRYRCHTGHAFTANALLAGVNESVEDTLWNAVRVLEENTMLLQQLGEYYAGLGETHTAELLFDKAHESQERTRQVRAILLRHDSLSEPVFQPEPGRDPG